MQESGLLSFLDDNKGIRIIAVGDQVSASLIKAGARPSLIIWDGMSLRKPIPAGDKQLLESFAPFKKVKNPAATISKAAWDSIQDALTSGKQSVFVEGEEDLLTIPAVLLSEGGSAVIYGLPGKGIVLIVVNRNIKAEFERLLSDFSESK